MKLKHRALALILTLMMVLAYMPAMAFAGSDFSGEGASGGVIGVNDVMLVTITEEAKYNTFEFTPDHDGEYCFRAISEEDTYGRVLDSNMNQISFSDDDSDNDDVDFSVIFEGEAGKTYYLQATYLNDDTGEFSVELTEVVRPVSAAFSGNLTGYIGEGFVDFFQEGYKFTITYSDGSQADYIAAVNNNDYIGYYKNGDIDSDDMLYITNIDVINDELVVGNNVVSVTVNVEDDYNLTTTVNVTGVPYEDDDDDDPYYDYHDFGDLPEDLDTIEEIELDKVVNVTVSPDDPISTYKFVAEEDGYYTYESYGTEDAVGQVRTEEEIIADNDDSADTDDLNFKVTFWADAGETYYLRAKGFDNGTLSFKVKAAYFGVWTAYADDVDHYYEGSPVTLSVTTEGDTSNVKYNWYRYNTLIKANGAADLAVSSGGRYYCVVSDGKSSAKVPFDVDLNSVVQNNLWFNYAPYDDTATVEDYHSGLENLTKGNVTIPSTVKFADGIVRTVRYVDIFAPEMVSVNIPASVTYIEPGLGFKTWTWDDDDNITSYTLIPGFVIYGKTGSAAQNYAKKYNIRFRDLAAEAEAARQGTYVAGLPKVKMSKPKAAKKSITVKWKKLNKKQLKKGVNKIEVWVCPNSGFGAGDTIIKETGKKKSSLKVKGLKKGTYFVKVRAIKKVGNVKYYTAWSAPKKVKVKK